LLNSETILLNLVIIDGEIFIVWFIFLNNNVRFCVLTVLGLHLMRAIMSKQACRVIDTLLLNWLFIWSSILCTNYLKWLSHDHSLNWAFLDGSW